MESLLFQYLILWKPLGYFLIFLGTIIEGTGTVFIAAFLAYNNFLNIFFSFPVVLSGILLGDFIFYQIGKKINGSSNFINKITNRIKFADSHIINNLPHTIFVAKFTWGIFNLIMIRAGTLNVPYKHILKYDLFFTIAWILAIGGLGYLFGASFSLIKKSVRFVEVGLLITLIIFFIIEKFVKKRSEKKL